MRHDFLDSIIRDTQKILPGCIVLQRGQESTKGKKVINHGEHLLIFVPRTPSNENIAPADACEEIRDILSIQFLDAFVSFFSILTYSQKKIYYSQKKILLVRFLGIACFPKTAVMILQTLLFATQPLISSIR